MHSAVLPASAYRGLWTPSLTFGGLATGLAATQIGKFLKVGSWVFATCSIVTTSKGTATGVAAISGLPFTPATPTGGAAAVEGISVGAGLHFYWDTSGALIRLRIYTPSTGSTSAVTDALFAAVANTIRMQLQFEV